MKATKYFTALILAGLGTAAFAGIGELDMDRPSGIRIGERLTLRPYVSLSYTYDSNPDSAKHADPGNQWVINPGIQADFIGENWKIDGAAWYQYHAYDHYSTELNSSSYGERLNGIWRTSAPNEKGWSFLFTERFEQVAQDDDMSNHDGRGIGRDRKEFNADGVLERRLNSNIHIGANASYYLLDYENNVSKYRDLYGWKRATAGGEVGYMASKWTDFVFAANYQWYWQDNDADKSNRDVTRRRGRTIKSDSRGWTIMGGIATRATERIEYRLLGGWSRFKYGDGGKNLDGFTYQVSAQWRITDTMKLAALGSSYYQPSERDYGAALKVYTGSIGLTKGFVRAKLSATADLAFRKECHEYSEYAEDDYDEDIWTGRVGLNYHLNRFFTFFGRIEYQFNDSEYRSYEYDRWRATVGVRLSY